MCHVTYRSQRMKEHKFSVMCSGVLFMEPAMGHPKYEKYCIDVSHLGSTRMHNVTRRSHRSIKIVNQCFGPRRTRIHYVSANPTGGKNPCLA
jgi:hypothetical protein